MARSRGLGDVYKRQEHHLSFGTSSNHIRTEQHSSIKT
jgi:hypothetical protein